MREGDAGSSMFVVLSGEAAVTLAGTDGEVARLRAGRVLRRDVAADRRAAHGHGDRRAATATMIEIGVDAFRDVVLADPAIVERVTAAVAARRAELERHRTTRGTTTESPELAHTFLAACAAVPAPFAVLIAALGDSLLERADLGVGDRHLDERAVGAALRRAIGTEAARSAGRRHLRRLPFGRRAPA